MISTQRLAKGLLDNPAVVFVLIYAYWLISIPTEMIVWGAIVLGAFLLITVLGKFAHANKLLLLITIIVALLAASSAMYYTFLALWAVTYYGVESITSGVILIIGVVVIILSARKKFSAENTPLTKFLFACTLPLMLLSILFFSIFYPAIKDTVFFQRNRYHLVSQTNDDLHSYQTFYKCNWFGFYCEALYSSNGYGDAKIIVDYHQNEIAYSRILV